jgi:UDP-3-O-[3-hydroxymyristoyl] glucosamine N-acyltransferase
MEDEAGGRDAAVLRSVVKLGRLIEILGGTLVQGNAELEIEGVSSYDQADPDRLVFAENPATAAEAQASDAGAIVLRFGQMRAYSAGKSIVEASEPRLWFARAAKLLEPEHRSAAIHPTAIVPRTVGMGEGVAIGPYAVIGEDVSIDAGTRIEAGAIIGQASILGKGCRIHPRVVLYGGSWLGDRVIIHAGAVLGADGFGYVRDPDSGAYTQFPQQGTLVIEDDVEIGANSTIDRGALGETRIRRGTKIDNLVHVGHNCDIGEDVILVALTGISGSSTVGKGAILAGQVGIGDHAHVGPGVILGGQSGVFNGKTVSNEGLRPGTVLYGTPARPLKQVLREQAVLARLAKKTGNRE